jgi:hypothetical protein
VKCKFWTHLLGKDPQREGTVDKFGCAIEFIPILLVENAQMIRQGAASTDKVANQVAAGNAILNQAKQIALAERLEQKIVASHK